MSVLIDTSVWSDHFRRSNPVLAELMEFDQALTHPQSPGRCENSSKEKNYLASTLITPGAMLWTFDKRLSSLSSRFGVCFAPHLH